MISAPSPESVHRSVVITSLGSESRRAASLKIPNGIPLRTAGEARPVDSTPGESTTRLTHSGPPRTVTAEPGQPGSNGRQEAVEHANAEGESVDWHALIDAVRH